MEIQSRIDGNQSTDLRSRVLRAGRELFFQKGYATTTTRAIATTAGTSESGVFRMYASKYELLMAVYNDCWREVNMQVESRLRGRHSGDPRQYLVSVVRIVWELYQEPANRLMMSFIIINTGNTDTLLVDRREKAIISEENLKYIARINGLCHECKTRGLLLPELSVNALTEGILGITEGILLGWYLFDNTRNGNASNGNYGWKIGIEEALSVVRLLVFGTTLPSEKEKP